MFRNLPTIHIQMFAEFVITVGNECISDQSSHSKKLWNLLEYLIINRKREIPQQELIQLLWSNEKSNNPSGALKTLMHRVRSLLKDLNYPSEFILQCRGSYYWNQNLPCVIDIDQFEAYCEEADNSTVPEIAIEKYKKAFSLYKGDFLPQNNCEQWSVTIADYYHNLYLHAIKKCISIMMAQNLYAETANLCWQALTIDPYIEEIHYALIRSLYLSDNQKAAIQQYSTTTNLFFSKFGITPSNRMKSIYKEIVKTTKDTTHDLDSIRNSLKESEKQKGPFYCEYEFFKDVYRIQVRAQKRTSSSIYLCLLTITTPDEQAPDLKLLNESMDKLKESIIESLRLSDIFSRYSVSQYIIILLNISFENTEMVMKRVISEFYKKSSKNLVKVNYAVQALDTV